MKQYIITIGSTSLEHLYSLDIFPQSNTGSIIRRKSYGEDELRGDLNHCVHTTAAGFKLMLERVAKMSSWTSQVSLTASGAERLGWFE
jgi:hypothetical protein